MQVGGVFVRIRPALAPEDAQQLDQLSSGLRELADQIDAFRDQFVVAPREENETVSTVVAPLRLIPSRLALPEGDPAA